jgi:hypothetical protein
MQISTSVGVDQVHPPNARHRPGPSLDVLLGLILGEAIALLNLAFELVLPLSTREGPDDVIKFVAPGRRKIAPPPQRPLWRQSLCELETRALALQRD